VLDSHQRGILYPYYGSSVAQSSVSVNNPTSRVVFDSVTIRTQNFDVVYVISVSYLSTFDVMYHEDIYMFVISATITTFTVSLHRFGFLFVS
jgi:hypothetical protein